MSMTGLGSEEKESSSTEKLTPEPSKANNSAVCLKSCSVELNRCFSPMLGVLGHKDVVPRLLQYEQALLVIKEHSYAKAPERLEVLQLSNVHAKELNGPKEEQEDLNSLLDARTDLLQLRESFTNERSEPSVVCHLRQVIGLQVALVREQQEQLHEKDRELNAVKKEKEQLEARLERMERRLAILQKHSRSKQTNTTNADSPITSPRSPIPPNSLSNPAKSHLTRRESIIAAETQSRGSSVEPGTRTRSRPSSRAGSPVENSIKRSQKRKIRDADKEDRTPRKKSKQQKELRTDFEYQGLELSVPKQRTPSQSEPSPQTNQSGADTPMSCSEISLGERIETTPIVTPSWRSLTVNDVIPESVSDCEDLSDDMFSRRHKKPEEDEKRRKRWDMQRARTLREHHELLRKYNMKSGEKGCEKKESEKPLTTFLPDLSEIDTIEVMDTVTVSAFGRPLPVIKPSEFELPWFDLDLREAKENVRKTRSKTRSHKTSVGGSADEL